MRGAEYGEVKAARAQHDHLPHDYDLHPSLESRADQLRVARPQRVTKELVVQAVLDGERRQEGDQAETEIGAVAQRVLSRVGAEAAGANPRSNRTAGHGHTAHLQVGHEPPVDPVLGVTDVVSVLRLFAANRASLGHEPPSDWD